MIKPKVMLKSMPLYKGLPIEGTPDDISCLKANDTEGVNPVVALKTQSHVEFLDLTNEEERDHFATIRQAVSKGLGVYLEDVQYNFNNNVTSLEIPENTFCTAIVLWREECYTITRKPQRDTTIKKVEKASGPKGMDQLGPFSR